MIVTIQDSIRNTQSTVEVNDRGIRIGRSDACQIQLPSRFVSAELASLERGPAGWELSTREGINPIELNGESIIEQQCIPIEEGSILRVAEFVLVFKGIDFDSASDDAGEQRAADRAFNQLQSEFHTRLLEHLDLQMIRETKAIEGDLRSCVESRIAELLRDEFHDRIFGNPPVRSRFLMLAYQIRLEGMLVDMPPARINPLGSNPVLESEVISHMRILCEMLGVNEGEFGLHAGAIILDSERMASVLDDLLASVPESVQNYLIAQIVKKYTNDMLFGLGPLQDLLDMPGISEIMVVDPNLIYVEREGTIIRTNRSLLSAEMATAIIDRIVSGVGRRIDHSQPLVDARLPDGSRLNAVIPPIAVRGPCLTIRRFPEIRLTAENLVERGTISRSALTLLAAAVKCRENIVVVGGTGSGKTTLLNILSECIADDERIVTIEDSAELRLNQQHVITLETKPANAEGTGAYSIRDLVRNALRMRPDRLIVGECRGPEALDMLQAMNTGHDGSLTTLHANSPREALSRLETMVLMAVDMPVSAIRSQIAGAIDLVVFIMRTSDGNRRITHVTEISGINPITQEIETKDIMTISHHGGRDLRATGYMPQFIEQAVDLGVLDLEQWYTSS